ncbi:MAG: fructose-bisphosphate aldolase class I [Candidatus Saccharibacteria bacterium]|nr:fructose-bisphosphate aldolase class I [Candidatus Saccharibacteria bacterium]
MSNILIVGNITKDVYLRLDNRQNKFETDQNDIKWLDFAFDGSTHKYYNRVSIFGGASISLEVLTRFGLTAEIANTSAKFLDGQFIVKDANIVYRYILCQDRHVSYLSPSDYKQTTWEIPKESVDWIYADRSASISPKLAEELIEYLDLNHQSKLALFVGKYSNVNANHMRELINRASIVITDTKLNQNVENLVVITPHHIEYMGKCVRWQLEDRQDLMTHLSSHLTIGASVFGALVLGKDADEALLLARANIERSILSSSSNISTLEEEISDDFYRVEKHNPKEDKMLEVESNAKRLVSEGRGILAADESGGSIHKKFEGMNIPDDEQHRRDYRNLFFTTPDLEKFVNGVILFDETARQQSDDGRDFVTFLADKGILPGIKVDQGLESIDGTDEKYTKGLDGLSDRLAEYYQMGARFAKWRAAFEVTDHSPSQMAIRKNAEILAQYALDCQNAGIVPIVEPELVYDGDYPIEKNIEFTGQILDALFEELKNKNVSLPGCILKVNMVLAGKRYHTQSTPAEVGKATADVLKAHVPSNLAGVVFLSGGQSVTQATDNLQKVTNNGPFPWPVTFSFARALQDPALNAWKGNNENADAARAGFRERLVANCEALKRK